MITPGNKIFGRCSRPQILDVKFFEGILSNCVMKSSLNTTILATTLIPIP